MVAEADLSKYKWITGDPSLLETVKIKTDNSTSSRAFLSVVDFLMTNSDEMDERGAKVLTQQFCTITSQTSRDRMIKGFVTAMAEANLNPPEEVAALLRELGYDMRGTGNKENKPATPREVKPWEIPIPDSEDIDSFEIEVEGSVKTVTGPFHHSFPTIARTVAQNVQVLLVGPAGSGKTTACEKVAEVLELPFYFSGAIASEHKLAGYTDAHGTYHRTPFRDAFEHGGLFTFDEIDGSMPNALLKFNAALANNVCDFPDGIIKRHPDFRVIACANTYGRGADRQYVGRAQLDAASLDRFSVFDFDYDERLERMIAGDTDWTTFVQDVRQAVAATGTRHIVSPRAAITGNRLISAGMNWRQVENMTVWKGLPDNQIEKILKACKGPWSKR